MQVGNGSGLVGMKVGGVTKTVGVKMALRWKTLWI
jgi:hypothetical protein